MAERLQKILANTGLGSRRELEQWIAAGDVRLNGHLAQLGDRATVDDNLVVRGKFYKVVAGDKRRRVLAYHKPLGELTTRDDPEKRRTIFQSLPRLHQGRWISVGRLDINTLGLLLVTDDGQLANKLMHPSSGCVREYAVRIQGEADATTLERLRTGVELEDGLARFTRLTADEGGQGTNHWYRVQVQEGRNRLVRRLWESQGVQVSRLIRTRFGPISLPRWLPRGKVQELSEQEIESLLKAAGLSDTRQDNLRIVPVHPRHRRKARRKR